MVLAFKGQEMEWLECETEKKRPAQVPPPSGANVSQPSHSRAAWRWTLTSNPYPLTPDMLPRLATFHDKIIIEWD